MRTAIKVSKMIIKQTTVNAILTTAELMNVAVRTHNDNTKRNGFCIN